MPFPHFLTVVNQATMPSKLGGWAVHLENVCGEDSEDGTTPFARRRPCPDVPLAAAVGLSRAWSSLAGPCEACRGSREGEGQDQVVEEASQANDRAQVIDFMAREDVRQQLEALGIDPDEAAQRAFSLSDEEVQQIAGQLDELPAGQDGVGAVVGAILLILLILLITDLLGLTNVFPFVKSQRVN